MTETSFNIFYTDDDLDDHELFADVVASISSNHMIYPQYNGQELLNMLRLPHPKPDLIFLDLNMPKKNGFEVLKEMKEDDDLLGIPIVVFSTSLDEQIIKTCKGLGANLYLTKPDSYPVMKKMINDVLSINWKKRDLTSNFEYTAS